MLDERPLEQAQSVISFYIACANDLARWFSVLHQLVAAGGDDPSLDEIAGISSSKELSLAQYMALAAAMGDDVLVSQAEGEAISAAMTNATDLDVTNPHARAWYVKLSLVLQRVFPSMLFWPGLLLLLLFLQFSVYVPWWCCWCWWTGISTFEKAWIVFRG